MSRQERTKAAAAASGEAFAEARCFVLSAGSEYKRRERAQYAAVVLHDGGDQAAGIGGHPCAVWASAARELFKRRVPHDAPGANTACLLCSWSLHVWRAWRRQHWYQAATNALFDTPAAAPPGRCTFWTRATFGRSS